MRGLRLAIIIRVCVCVAIALIIGCGKVQTPSTHKAAKATASAGQKETPHEEPAASRPQAFVDKSTYDFGSVSFGANGNHTFVVLNRGESDLKLKLDEVSCKCTQAELKREVVPPGESTEIHVAWKVEEELQFFKQWLRLRTNDPAQKEIVLRVEGLVREEFRVEPAELQFGEIPPPNTESVAEATIVSDESESLSLERIEVSNAAFEVEAEALSAEELLQLRARGGYKLRVKSPAGMPTGAFSEVLNIHAKIVDSGRSREISIPISGRIMGRVSIFGAGIDQYGSVMFGTLAHGKGATARLKLKLRDEDGDLKVRDIKVNPEFVKVELRPNDKAERKGLYDLVVSIPPDTEPCAYRFGNEGTIHFEFDHPRVKKLDLKVDFSVRPPVELPISR